MKMIATAFALLLANLSLSGCVLGLAAGAGAVGYDEATEKDGEFDPLEKAYDEDEDTQPLDDD
jgi:hypothetical protein